MPRILVIVGGNKGHGKDVLSNMVAGMIPGCAREAFANPIKECVSIKTGIPMDILNGCQEVKDDVRFGRYGKSARQLVLEEGDEARNRLGELVWVDVILSRFRRSGAKVMVVSDGRLMQEFTYPQGRVENTKVVCVRIVRPGAEIDRGHKTETGVTDAHDTTFDFVLHNDSTLIALREKARQLADAIILQSKTGKQPSGWIVDCPTGQRHPEPYVLEAEADTLSTRLSRSCGVCGTIDDHTKRPVNFDLIEQA